MDYSRKEVDTFGRAVQSLDGAYITAEDVGSTTADMSRPSERTAQPSPLDSVLDVMVRRDTEAMEASASPRKPRVATASRSSR